MHAKWLVGWLALGGCDFPRPTEAQDAGVVDTAACAANAALRCEANALVRCNADGTAEVTERCPAGCAAVEARCSEVVPSNGLGTYFEMSAHEPAVDLGTMAVIDTDNGTVTVDGGPIVVNSVSIAQVSAPNIRVFLAHRVTAMNAQVSGSQSFAIVSDGEIRIGGTFSVSAQNGSPGPGRFNSAACKGGDSVNNGQVSGAGGGGFGTAGGAGGAATNASGTRMGGRAGTATGNAELTPLRGGCDGGLYNDSVAGSGGGAIQLVSGALVTVGGAVAANGSSFGSAGSGGGVLIEAPAVDVMGAVVANGAGGSSGCVIPVRGEDGRLDTTPAAPGTTCPAGNGASGGRGSSLTAVAANGADISRTTTGVVFGGHGGGGVGRIRINTLVGGLHVTGVFSPSPTTGTLATR